LNSAFLAGSMKVSSSFSVGSLLMPSSIKHAFKKTLAKARQFLKECSPALFPMGNPRASLQLFIEPHAALILVHKCFLFFVMSLGNGFLRS